jgi:hypothetical protein
MGLVCSRPPFLWVAGSWLLLHNQQYLTPIALQNKIFLIHPILLIGVVLGCWGFITPQYNLKNSYKRLSFLFLFMSFSLFLGGFWAQQEFNWGGWWSWDSVEMTSLWLWLWLLLYTHQFKIYGFACHSRNQVLLVLVSVVVWSLNRSSLFSSIHSFSGSYVFLYMSFCLKLIFSYVFCRFALLWPSSLRGVIFYAQTLWFSLYLLWFICVYVDLNVSRFRWYQPVLYLLSGFYVVVVYKREVGVLASSWWRANLYHLVYFFILLCFFVGFNLTSRVWTICVGGRWYEVSYGYHICSFLSICFLSATNHLSLLFTSQLIFFKPQNIMIVPGFLMWFLKPLGLYSTWSVLVWLWF